MKHILSRCWPISLLLIFSLIVSACGGGGGTSTAAPETNNTGGTGGGNYSISLNKTSLTFTGNTDGNVSAGIEVRVTYKGDGVIVGFPPNIDTAYWLDVTTRDYTATTATFLVAASPSYSAGEFSTTLRFITGKEDGSATRYIDLPVTFTVSESFSTYSAQPSPFSFSSVGRDSSNLSDVAYAINIVGADSQWTVASEDWISVSPTSGNGQATLTVTVDPNIAQYGTNLGTIEISDSVSGNSFSYNVRYQMDHASVSVDTSEHFFAVLPTTTSAELVGTIAIADELQGNSPEDVYTWEFISSSEDWLSLTSNSGTTAAGETTPVLQVDKTALLQNAAGERYEAEITINTRSDFADTQTHVIKVSTFIASEPIAVTGSTANEFAFTVNRAAHASASNKLYLSDTNANRLYVADATSGETLFYYPFNEMPESVYVSPDGSRLYVALLHHEHDYFQPEPSGKIAVIDLENGLLINKFAINADPWDLVASDAGEVYVIPGSGQWVELNMYDANTGNILYTSVSLRHRSQIILAPWQTEVYTVTTDSSPSDITRYYLDSYNGEEFLNSQDSPYHGDYRIWDDIWIEPTGDNILSRGGDLFSTDGLIFVKAVSPSGVQINDVAYDTVGERAVLLDNNGTLASYALPNYDNYQVISNTLQDPKHVFTYNGEILVIDNTETGYKLIKP